MDSKMIFAVMTRDDAGQLRPHFAALAFDFVAAHARGVRAVPENLPARFRVAAVKRFAKTGKFIVLGELAD